MKKYYLMVLLVLMLFGLVGCDKSFYYFIEVVSTEDIALYDIDSDVAKQELTTNTSGFNNFYGTEYKNIDFDDLDILFIREQVGSYKFNLLTSKDTINVKIELINVDRYLIDFIRIGVKYQDELYIYKLYDENEEMFDKENDPPTILHFEKYNLITEKLNLNILRDDLNELTIIYWVEKGEGFTPSGEVDTYFNEHISDMRSMNLKVSIS